MTQEEFEDLKGRIFRDIEAVKNTHRHQVLPKRSPTITKESQRVGILPTTTQQASSSTQDAEGSSSSCYVYYTPSPIGFGNPPSVLTVQGQQTQLKWNTKPDTRSKHRSLSSSSNSSSSTPSPPQHRLNSSSLLSSQPVRLGLVPPIGPFQGRPNLPKTIIKLQVVQIPLPKHNSSVQILITKQKKKAQHPHHPKHETNNPW